VERDGPQRLLEENTLLKSKEWAKYEIIGRSKPMVALKNDIRAGPRQLDTHHRETEREELVARNIPLLQQGGPRFVG
jgi:hypothetical protein